MKSVFFLIAKLSNRLSSDTDNETDRLLGSQRNEQLKLANSDVNGSNSTDIQPVGSNMIKQNSSSKEGKIMEDLVLTASLMLVTYSMKVF